MLLLHSSTGRTLRTLKKLGFTPDIQTILDSFLEALGASGTLLLPLFNSTSPAAFPLIFAPHPARWGL